ncbi:uncharacterized protein LOC141618257 [Silene latifolia]|uniref:uncharacterized protein LOC141618257 n=1 Tax=Silene latifolia TaxID=37657 RepID=UPI003D775780
MEGKENKEGKSGNKTKQQITVPFLWEEKPGAPKENWETPKREPLTAVHQPVKYIASVPFNWEEKPGEPKEKLETPKCEPLTAVHQPVKYIASVPFKWEEKPGTPLRCFAKETKERTVHETVPEDMNLPLPPAYFAKYGNDSDGDYSSYGDDNDYQDWLSEMDFETLSALSEDSISSAPSLNANGPTPSRLAVSSVVPLQNPFLIEKNDGHMEEGSSSPESSNSPTNASRNASLRGASFLQHLFPLYPPKTGFLDKPDNSEENNGQIQFKNERRLPTLEEYKKFDAEFRRSGIIRKPLTLGELIMQSRRRSYRRKAVQMKKNNPPKDFTDDKPHGCFNLGASGGGLTKLLGKELQPLKLS